MTKINLPGTRPAPHRAFLFLLLALACLPLHAQTASLALTGLRTVANQGQFNAIQSDAAGNLYLLLDQHDGIRLIKTNPTVTTILAQAHLGAQGDIGLALALDPAGNPYITGTTTSGALTSTAGAAFPTPTATSTNSFITKLDPNLNLLFLTFGGSGKLAAASIAATSNAVYITGSIFSATLPVTPSAILQTPSTGSLQNGFVEKFDATGTTLLYATYLTGATGDTTPSALTVDPSGNAYITGYTSASGYPTLAALVPNIIPSTPGTTSGFLTKLTPAGDGIIFSTFIPGDGLTSITFDPATQNLLLSGSVALGQFPIATATRPIIPATYQTLLRLPLDGRTVIASTLLAPGTQSTVTPAPNGTAWIAGALTLPLLPTQALSTMGNTFATHVSAADVVDQTARFGGLPNSKPTFAGALANLTSLISDSAGQPTIVGSINPQASTSLLTTETFDLPLYSSLTPTLPSVLHDAVPNPASCTLSLCPGSAAYLTRLTNTAVPSLALSYDAAPNLILRNLGATQATSLNITSTTFAITTNCPPTLAPSADCNIALAGTPPGTLILQAANATPQTITIPTFNATQSPVVFSPKELDFGIQTAISAPITRTITITNLTQQSQTFASKLDASATTHPYTLTESSSDCTLSGPTTKLLAAGGTCHITLALTASSSPANNTLFNAQWLIGTSDVLLTGYTQAAALSLSSSEIDFGTQYTGGLHLPRFLYLSNPSDTTAAHSLISTSSPVKIQDHCPTQLAPRTICQLQLDYIPTQTPSNDSVTLNLDQGLTALVTGQSLPQPGTNGASTNPNLTVTPTSINFLNPVVVTSTSSSTQTVTIGNTGATPFALSLSLSLSGDFTDTTNCTATLAANATCTAVISFSPSQPGTRQGILSVTAGAATPIYVNLSGTGTTILPANNGTLALGSVIVGQPAIQWFKITQSFNPFTAAISGSDFTTILVEDIPDLIDLSGSAAPTLVASPSNAAPLLSYTASQNSLTFASTSVGNLSLPQTVTLSNTGTATLHILSLSISPDFTVTSVCSAIVPGASCDLTLFFSPQKTGTRVGALEILSDSSSSLDFITLVGTATPSILTLSPAALDFGTLLLGNTGTLPLQITNTSSNIVTFNGVSATGDYAASIGSCPSPGATLPVASSCTLQISFTPTATGTRTGTISLATSATNVPLIASRRGIGAQSHHQSAPATLRVGTIAIGSPAILSFTLTNSGNAPITGLSLATSLGDYAITIPCVLTTIAPGASCTVTVTFTPTAIGARTATLTVNSSATTSPDLIPLTGTGIVNGTFTLTVNSATAASATVSSGRPATYTLTITPINNFSGTVVLNCTPITPADFTTCGILPSTITLNGTPQNAIATLQTIASITLSKDTHPNTNPLGGIILSLLTPTLFFFWRKPNHTRITTLWTTFLTAAALATLLTSSGCGSGGDPSIRYSTPGTYQYQITASSTSGIQITQSVTLNLTITSR